MENPSPNSDEESVRLQKLHDLKKEGINPFQYSYSRTHSIHQILEAHKDLAMDQEVDVVVSLAGRLMAKRGHGKATFGNIQDESGAIQYYANVDALGEADYERLLKLDTGDIVGIVGKPFRTKRGELSIKLSGYTLLTKSLKQLPEKYHGLQDKELRYRQRYVDLIVNQDVLAAFKKRSEIIRSIRGFLNNLGFMEVETPVLHAIYGGAAAKPFQTHHNDLEQDLYLRIALELHHKRLIVGGFEKIFEIGRVFRNEGVSFKHNPEYTLLELYQAYADYSDIMTLTETLISQLVFQMNGSYELTYQGTAINFKPPFERITLKDAILKYAGVDSDQDVETLRTVAQKMGLDISHKPLKGQLINYIYDKAVEPHLIQPVFMMDYPWETSPLAKRKRDNPELVERFELIAHKMELANAFSELNDPIDQMERFQDQLKAKEAGDEEAQMMDEDFVNALKYGMPPTGGLGIGIDRIVMLLTDSASIRDVLFFPHMRTKNI